MNINDINKYKKICVMGLGKMYGECIQELEQMFCINYVCDNNPSYIKTDMTSKYKFLPSWKLPRVNDLFVIVTTSFENYVEIDNQLSILGIPHCFVLSIPDINVSRPVIQMSMLKQNYEDKWGNVIELAESAHIQNRHSFVMFGDDTNKPECYGRGRNNRLRIGENTKLLKSFMIEFWGSDCYVDLGNDSSLGIIHAIIAQKSVLRVGNRCKFQGLYAVVYEGGLVAIGEDCMFSHNIQLWQTDTHPIFSIETGERLNKSRDIIIGNHVWLGANVTLLGGANIGNGSIIGMNSVTSGGIPPNVSAAGNPARVVRENVLFAMDELYLSDINSLNDCKYVMGTKLRELL